MQHSSKFNNTKCCGCMHTNNYNIAFGSQYTYLLRTHLGAWWETGGSHFGPVDSHEASVALHLFANPLRDTMLEP